MITATLAVFYDDIESVQEWQDLELPGVPRVGDSIVLDDELAPEGYETLTVVVDAVEWIAGTDDVWLGAKPHPSKVMHTTVDDAMEGT
jgi:hypothetical protein